MGLLGGLVVMFAAARMPRSEVQTPAGYKFGSRFQLYVHPCSASETSTSFTKAISKPGNSPKK